MLAKMLNREEAMADAQAEPKLLLPILRPFYDAAIPLSWLIVRVAVGWNLLVHGWGKVSRGPAAFVKGFADLGFEPALAWVWGGLLIEFVGGIALILGLFTRFFAAAAAIEMLVITDSIVATEAVRAAPNIRQLTIAPLMAEAMQRISEERSVSSLFD